MLLAYRICSPIFKPDLLWIIGFIALALKSVVALRILRKAILVTHDASFGNINLRLIINLYRVELRYFETVNDTVFKYTRILAKEKV